MTFNYWCDKETNNTYRFQPDDRAKEVLGQATIYIRKSALLRLGIKDPRDGLVIELKGVATNG